MRYVKAFIIGLLALLALVFVIENIEVLKHQVINRDAGPWTPGWSGETNLNLREGLGTAGPWRRRLTCVSLPPQLASPTFNR